jgi:hypothetical protein
MLCIVLLPSIIPPMFRTAAVIRNLPVQADVGNMLFVLVRQVFWEMASRLYLVKK